MKKIIAFISCISLVAAMSLVTFAAGPNVVGDVGVNYPNLDGYVPPEGSVIISGKVIGAATGWDNNPAVGALCAFDGDHGSIYDQRVDGQIDTEYPGIMADEAYILTAARVIPTCDADWQAARMNGAAFQGSDDGATWTTLYKFTSAAEVGNARFYTVTDFENNTGYKMFRYCNIDGGHTDCRELQFFGYVKKASSTGPNVVGDVGANYPNLEGYTPPEGSDIILGKVIGAATGWDNNPYVGALCAFDGDHGNIYDQRVDGKIDTEYPGIMADKAYILTAARVIPTCDADWQAGRMNGAAFQGSDDGVTWTTLYKFTSAAEVGNKHFYTVTDFENNTGYKMYRYCNIDGGHTDCFELQFFGYVKQDSPDTGDTVSCIALACAAAVSVAVITVKKKKNK